MRQVGDNPAALPDVREENDKIFAFCTLQVQPVKQAMQSVERGPWA